MKVKGIPREDGQKDYLITHDGEEHLAVRENSSSLFSCNGLTATLKQIKTRVLLGQIPAAPEQEKTKVEKAGLWDHVDACALLVLTIGDQSNHKYQSEIMRTLDANGYLTETGAPDYRRAMHQLKVNREKTINGQ